jgi:hypothetical protein
VPDPVEQLARIYQAGFEIEQFERLPRALGLVRNECILLVEPSPEGLRPLGTAGWHIGEILGVLTEYQGRQVFQAKDQIVEATPERLQRLRAFEADVKQLLSSG